ncbi:MAG: 4Fe-4S binding protein [Coriobacteriaceae bacterium]|jgi:Pyruvate/2-oxoacid:ferredoxin oxidoreductase delta subunit|nr:4Fe-4S binding protein [Coriobacteriaceae bacterium]
MRDSEAKILVLRDFCTRAKGADCERCAIACPQAAISLTPDGGTGRLPLIDAARCNSCGICLGICDAFSSTRVTLLDVHTRARRIALKGDAVCFTCKENIFPGLEPAACVIVLPCLASLPPEFWALLLAENIPTAISCDLAYCADCDRAGELGERLYAHAIKTAEAWCAKKLRFRDTIPEKEALLKDLADPEGVDRRGAFTNLIGDVGDIASGKRRLRNSEVLQQFLERRERSRAIAQLNFSDIEEPNSFAPLGHTKKTLFPKRQMLLEALEYDPAIAPRIPFFHADIDPALCRGELCCCGCCPTGALSPHPDTGARNFHPRYCVACGICQDTCPHGAINLVEATAQVLVQADEAAAADPPSGNRQA